jgi:hypothetical protein
MKQSPRIDEFLATLHASQADAQQPNRASALLARLLAAFQQTLDWPEDRKVTKLVEEVGVVLEERQNETHQS